MLAPSVRVSIASAVPHSGKFTPEIWVTASGVTTLSAAINVARSMAGEVERENSNDRNTRPGVVGLIL